MVRIETDAANGTGVIFETQGRAGYVVTNYHVVEGFRQVRVVVDDTSTYEGTVLGIDQVRDLAVVSICCGSFRSLPFGDASSLEPGDEVVAIGYALGLSGEASITRGIVSAIRYDPVLQSNVIQTDAAINPGNSGGPMLSTSGEILGINTYRYDRAEGGRPTEGLGFAISEKTVQAGIPLLKTARPARTPTPTLEVSPTPPATYKTHYGPVNGQLWHNPSDGLIKTDYASISLTDALVTATFFNPYSRDLNTWDYGLIFRDSGSGDSRRFMQIVVTSDSRWALGWRDGADAATELISEGMLSRIDTSPGGRNRIWVAAFGQRGLLFINGKFISVLDLSLVADPGDIAVITGVHQGNELPGATTRFQGFQVFGLERAFHLGDDAWQKGQDYLVETEFKGPEGTEWFHGFLPLNSNTGNSDAVLVNSHGNWMHFKKSSPGDDVTEVAVGQLADSGASIMSRNRLLLVVFGNRGWLFVNDVFVSELDLTNSEGEGLIGFAPDRDDAGSPVLENFNVWTPQR